MTVVAQLMVKIGADIAGAVSGLNQVNGAVTGTAQRIGASMTSAGQAVSGFGRDVAAISVPVAAGLGASAMAASDFDRELRNIQSIGGQTNAELQALGGTFLSMSQNANVTTDSATRLAEGFYQIQSSGFAGADAMTVLEVSTKAASAGLTSTDVAANAIVATLNAYGMTASESARVSDTLFRTVDLGVLSFEELATNLGDVVGTGNVAKVSIDELGGAFVVLTRNGISAAESATAINQLMLSFISPSEGAAKAAKALGVELSAEALASKGLAGVMQEIAEKTGGNAEAMAALFPNVRALKAALALARDEGKPFVDVMDQMGQASGRAEAAFKTQTQSYAAQAAVFKNTMQALAITLGQELMPILMDLVKAITPIIKAFSNLPAPVKKAIVVFGLIIAAVTPVAMAIGSIVSAIGALVPVFGAIAGGIGAVIGVIASALAPILAVIALVVAAVIALKVAWDNNFLGIRDTLTAAWEQVKRIFDAIKQVIVGFWEFLTGKISWEEFSAKVVAAGEQIKAAWTALWSGILEFTARIWEAIKTAVVNKLAEFIAPLVGGMDNAKRIVLQAWENIKTFLVTTWENIKAAALRVWEGIKQAVQTAIEAVRQVVATVLQVLSGDWVGAWERIKGKLVEVWETIKTVISTVVGVIVGVIRSGWEQIFSVVSGVMERVKTAIMNAWEAIKGIYARLKGQEGQITDPEQAAEQIRLWKQMVAELTAAWQLMSQTITTIATAVKQFLDAWLTAVQAQFVTIWTAIQTFLQSTWMTIQALVTSWLAAMLALMVTHLQQVQTAFITIWTAIQAFLLSTLTTIQTLITTALTAILTAVQQTHITMLASFTSTWAAIVSVVISSATTMSTQTITIVTDMANQVASVLEGLKDRAFTAGQAFGDAFAEGIRSKIADVAAAAGAMAATAASYLPGSDAERGALSNLTERGRQFGVTFAKGIAQSASAVAGAGGAIGSILLTGMSDNVDVGNVVDQMIEKIKIIMSRLSGLADYFNGPAGAQLKSVKAVLDPISQIMEMVAKTIGGIRALLDMQLTADAETKVRAAVAFLQRAIPLVIRGLATAAAQLQGPGIEAAKKLATAAGEIFGSVNTMVSALKSLMELNRGDVGAKMDILLSAMRVIMTKLRGFSMNLRELPILQAALEELITFLQGVAEIAKLLNTGLNIEAVYTAGKSIGELWVQGIVDGIRGRFGQLGDILRQVGNRMATPFGPAPGTPGAMPSSSGWGGAGAGPSSAGTTVNVTINNPVGQTAQGDIMRQLRNLSALGVLQPVRA